MDTPRPHDLDSKQGSDPIASLGLAKQLIREAQAAIEDASDSVVLQQVSSAEFPIFQLRLAQIENEKAELGVRLVEMEHQMGRIMTLYVATYQLHATLDPTDVQTTIGEISTNLLGAEQFALLLCDEDQQKYEIKLHQGEIPTPWSKAPHYPGGDSLIDASLSDGILRFGPADGSSALVVVPLRVQDITVGALVITKLFAHKKKLNEEDRELLDLLGAHAASALFASRVYSRAARKLRTLENLIQLVKKA